MLFFACLYGLFYIKIKRFKAFGISKLERQLKEKMCHFLYGRSLAMNSMTSLYPKGIVSVKNNTSGDRF